MAIISSPLHSNTRATTQPVPHLPTQCAASNMVGLKTTMGVPDVAQKLPHPLVFDSFCAHSGAAAHRELELTQDV